VKVRGNSKEEMMSREEAGRGIKMANEIQSKADLREKGREE